MKNDDLDRLIDELAAEAISQSGQSNEYVRGLMANASAVLDRYRMACRLAGAIGVVLDQAQVICEAPVATPDMVSTLREKGRAMWQAAEEYKGEPRSPEYDDNLAQLVALKAQAFKTFFDNKYQGQSIQCPYIRDLFNAVANWSSARGECPAAQEELSEAPVG